MAKNKNPYPPKLNVLALSDEVDVRIYSNHLPANFPDIDLVISCGDLPFYYLEFVVDTLNVPTYFVHGNHDPTVEIGDSQVRHQPWGAVNLDNRVVRHQDFILVGFEGSIRYSNGIHQFTQLQMWLKVLRVLPRLVINRLRYGRFFDVLVTHAPAWKVSDQPDPVHQGFKAFRWLLQTFKPRYHFHGHIHLHDRNLSRNVQFADTLVVNAHAYKRFEISMENESDA